jgi:hypothetical protein
MWKANNQSIITITKWPHQSEALVGATPPTTSQLRLHIKLKEVNKIDGVAVFNAARMKRF